MARTYKAPRKMSISGKAGKVKMQERFGSFEADYILHQYHAKKKLDKARRKDRRWKLSCAITSEGRLLNGH
jgi:hypothetical protein